MDDSCCMWDFKKDGQNIIEFLRKALSAFYSGLEAPYSCTAGGYYVISGVNMYKITVVETR